MEAPLAEKNAGGGDDVDPVPPLNDALQHFAGLVAAFYDSENGCSTAAALAPHAVLQAVLDTYERCKGSDGGVAVVSAADGAVHEHLQRIGFVRAPAAPGGGALDVPSGGRGVSMKLVHHERLEAFEVAKSQARSEYHARRAQQHEADFIGQLAALFDMRHIVHNEDNPGETLFFPEEEEGARQGAVPFPLVQAKASLAAFVQRYHKVLGTTPFLKGLRRVLEEQVEQTFAVRWTLAISVFTESGGQQFLAEALRLMHALRFRPLKLNHTEDGIVNVTWEVCAGLRDKDIAALLRTGLASTGLKKMPGSPTGTIAISDVQRLPATTSGDAGQPRPLKALLRKMKISS